MPHIVAHVEGDLDDAVHVGLIVVLDGEVVLLSLENLSARLLTALEDFLDAAINGPDRLGQSVLGGGVNAPGEEQQHSSDYIEGESL